MARNQKPSLIPMSVERVNNENLTERVTVGYVDARSMWLFAGTGKLYVKRGEAFQLKGNAKET